MEMAAAAGEVVNVAAEHGDGELGPLFQFIENVKTLKTKAQKMASRLDDLQQLVDDAQCNNDELIKETVTDWIDKVEDVLNEATKLVDKAGEIETSHQGPHDKIALKVLNECKPFSIAIAALGLALRNKDEIEWGDALTQLKDSLYEDMEGMDVFTSMVKLSYQFLQSESHRMCFLFCSLLFPQEYPIKNDLLLTYMLGEKLLKNVDTMEQARQMLHTIVDQLTSSGLLLSNKQGEIRLHGFIRDAAIRIASDPEGFIVKSGLGLSLWPVMELEKCKRLSLMVNILSNLPDKIVAPHLLTLSFLDNKYLEIPSGFFMQMKNLQTLDLSDTFIDSLPQSFSCLESLCTLQMDGCYRLRDISLIEKLVKLEILTVRYCGSLIQLPEGMGKLRNLKMFDASMRFGNEVTQLKCPPNLISSLHSLEELLLKGRGLEDSIFPEITSLTRLNRLDILLPVEALSLDCWDLWSPNLSGFKFMVGLSNSVPNWEVVFNEMHIINFPSSVRIPNWLLECLERTVYLNLDKCEPTESLVEFSAERKQVNGNGAEHESSEMLEELYNGELPRGFLCELVTLWVQQCPKIRVLIPQDLLVNLQNLEDVNIRENSALEKIVQLEEPSMLKQSGRLSSFPPSSFLPNLTRLRVKECHKLKCILPLEVAQGLLRLKWLEAGDCSDLEMIFENGGENVSTENLSFPRLEVLWLMKLPSFSSIGTPDLLVDMPTLVELEVTHCPELKTLGALSMPNLKKLNAKQDWFDNLEWSDESIKSHLQSVLEDEESEDEYYYIYDEESKEEDGKEDDVKEDLS